MDWLQVIVLALVQGISEFLPVSSSAHLVLVPALTDWPDQGLAFDVALHVGSLSAVVVYFRRDLHKMMASWCGSFTRRGQDENSRLTWWVILAMIPVGLVGLACKDLVEASLRSGLVIGASLAFFGLVLGWADLRHRGDRNEFDLTWKGALLIGLAQALALIPGTSRSGITMTAALMLGLSREASARFSFLLSIPVIVMAGGLKTFDLLESPVAVDWAALAGGTLLSGISAYLCIHYFLAFIHRIGMQPFVIYRVVFGLWLVWFFW